MVLIQLYKKFYKSEKALTEQKSAQGETCQHRRNTSSNSDIELTSPTVILHGGKPREPSALVDASSCNICKEEKRAMTKYRMKLMGGLFFPFLVQTLDSTIIAGALTFIASDFSEGILSLDSRKLY
jgi:hypothetical protein